jgi:hypothetical protein
MLHQAVGRGGAREDEAGEPVGVLEHVELGEEAAHAVAEQDQRQAGLARPGSCG